MTIEQIIGSSADLLEQLTDAEVLANAEKEGWLKVTRPELAIKPDKASSIRRVNNYEHNARVGKAKDFAAKWGLDLGDDLFD